MKTLLVLILATAVLAQDNSQTIQCPVPGNPSTVSEADCATYTACQFTNGFCSMKTNAEAGYVVSSDPVHHLKGFKVTLDKADATNTMFGADIKQLVLEVIYHEKHHAQIKIYDPANERYEVPIPLFLPSQPNSDQMYTVEVSEKGTPLTLSVKRNLNEKVIFKTEGPLTFEDQFMQITTKLASSYLYGIGENSHTSLKRSFDPRKTYSLFDRDQSPSPDSSTVNEYGTQPYYVNVEDDDGNTHSVLLHNSNAMEYSLFLLADGSPAVTMRTIGGILDFHIFMGPTPEDVNTQYYYTVGHPSFPPYWSFGFQLSRWGYNSLSNYKEVHDRMKAAEIPWDVQMFDIDYMDQKKDFTYDHDNYAGFPEAIQQLHDENMKVVLITDPALITDFDNYTPSKDGREADVFVKWMSPDMVPSNQPEGAGDYIVGKVWPEERVVFPDFMKPETFKWWDQELTTLRKTLKFDGIWIDMNEPSNFDTNMDKEWSLQCPKNTLDDPPYPTLAASGSPTGRLSDKTICMSSMQTDNKKNFTHYDVHNLYGYTESMATFNALFEHIFPQKRHLILSRSTFPGSGRYAYHWLGDNSATWDQLKMSLIGIMEFNMFAIPMVGADVCGFNGEPSEELCIRWMQAGAFYPFDRNHNTIGTQPQDPANPDWTQAPVMSKDVLLLRYQYIPYFYARFHRAHMNGHSVIRPLFNVFPTDINAREIQDQFFWSDDLMVAPVVEEGAVARDVYFPKGIWYDLVSGTVDGVGPIKKEVDAPLNKIPVYVRGGSILPYQEPATTTTESRKNPFGFTVALDENASASGEVFWDRDGETEHIMAETFIGQINFADNKLTLTPTYDPTAADGLMLETIKFYGCASNPDSISVNGKNVDSSSWTFDETTNVLVLKLSVPLNQALTVICQH